MIRKYSDEQLREMGIAEFHIQNWRSEFNSLRRLYKYMKYCFFCGKDAKTWTAHIHTDEGVIAVAWCNDCYPHKHTNPVCYCEYTEPKHSCYGYEKASNIVFGYPSNEAIYNLMR